MPESEARRTLSQSRFFLEQAHAAETIDRSAFEHFIEAAIVFGRSVTFHLQKEYSSRPGFWEWYSVRQAEMADDPIFSFLRDKRNYILKEGSIPVRQSISISLASTVMMSGLVEARVIRGQPWYCRRPSIWIQDGKAAIVRASRRVVRWWHHSTRRRPAPATKRVAAKTRLHFEDSPWRERAATDVIGEYLTKLESIVAEAERKFTTEAEE
jgi:hypothetical protein